jgi:hypothetical protein
MNDLFSLKKRIEDTGVKYKKIAMLIPCTQSHLTNGLNGNTYFSSFKIKRLDHILRQYEKIEL